LASVARRHSADARRDDARDGPLEDVARKIKIELESRGLHKEPWRDVVEPPVLFALQKEGLNIVDGQQLMSDAREIKTQDEISLLTHSAAMVTRPTTSCTAR
jgi:Xaa-Pro aminopeptidase